MGHGPRALSRLSPPKSRRSVISRWLYSKLVRGWGGSARPHKHQRQIARQRGNSPTALCLRADGRLTQSPLPKATPSLARLDL